MLSLFYLEYHYFDTKHICSQFYIKQFLLLSPQKLSFLPQQFLAGCFANKIIGVKGFNLAFNNGK